LARASCPARRSSDLADVFARLTAGLHLSQAGLARAIGMSPPMLSQLGSAHRVKIGNPAVLHRLEALQALLEEVEAGRVGEDELRSEEHTSELQSREN